MTATKLAHAEVELMVADGAERDAKRDFANTGHDWTAEEKSSLATAKATMVAGVLGAMATLAGAAAGVYAATMNRDAAQEREDGDRSEVNKSLTHGATGNLAVACIALVTTFGLSAVALYTGVSMYNATYKKHDERVGKLKSPEASAHRERWALVVEELRAQLEAEHAALRIVRQLEQGKSRTLTFHGSK
jgi:hypothetical protein